MRKDIAFLIETEDVAFASSSSLEAVKFEWCDNPDGLTRYKYGAVVLDNNMTEQHLQNVGVKLPIPHTPIYKAF